MRLCDLAYGCICGPMLRLHALISAIPAYGLVCGIGVDGPPIRGLTIRKALYFIPHYKLDVVY